MFENIASRRGWSIVFLGFLLSFVIPPDEASATYTQDEELGYLPLFDSKEKYREGLKAFPKWTNALKRHEEQEFPPEVRRWIESRRDIPLNIHLLNEINDFVNGSVKYVKDTERHGVIDYWAAPSELFQPTLVAFPVILRGEDGSAHRVVMIKAKKKAGDCEDYAVSKYLIAKAFGFKNMRVVVVQDMQMKVPHAILVVYLKNKIYVLDNQLSVVASHSRIHHYRPIYSVNEKNWWRHTPNSRNKKRDN
jgi:predicted transglutaminase-like cysteine proteinase